MNTTISNGFDNKKSLTEQINDIVKGKGSRRSKVEALIKLGIRENEVQFVLPREVHEPSRRFRYTFGVEIETAHCDSSVFFASANGKGLEVMNHLHQYAGCHNDVPMYKLVPDGSIQGWGAAECVTPALNGNASGFNSLKACCEALKESGATVNRSCGLHVHIGAANISAQQYVNVFKNYKMLEGAIDSFMAPSRRNNFYAASLTNHNFNDCHTVEDVRSELDYNRYHKVNSESYGRHQTIEFRQHQGTVNYKKIKMWVTFCAKLVAWSESNVLTTSVESIDAIPFLNDSEKAFFNSRKAAFEADREREAA